MGTRVGDDGATNQVRTSEGNYRFFSPFLFPILFMVVLLLLCVLFFCLFLFCFILVEGGSVLASIGLSSEP